MSGQNSNPLLQLTPVPALSSTIMKIKYFLVVPSDERFFVLADAIQFALDQCSLGVAAVFDNGLKVLLRAESATISEYHRVALDHVALVKMRYAGKRGPWYEMDASYFGETNV